MFGGLRKTHILFNRDKIVNDYLEFEYSFAGQECIRYLCMY